MIRAPYALLALVLSSHVLPVHASWLAPFISELHYDNAGADVDEFVAVSGPSGLDLSGWQIALYNGGDGRAYRSLGLSGTLGSADGGLAEVSWPFAGLQNGPDAVALISPLDAVIDFIAYEAGVVATEGAAQGLRARLLSVSEDGSTPVGYSLQRTGSADSEFWVVATATPGAVNPGLTEVGSHRIPTLGGGYLWFAGAGGWLLLTFSRRPRRRAV